MGEADDAGPEPLPQNEDSAAGGPFESAVDKKRSTALSLKKSYDSQGGVEGIKHGGELVKKWLKDADAKYDEKNNEQKNVSNEHDDDDADPDEDGKEKEKEQVLTETKQKMKTMEKKMEHVKEKADAKLRM